MMFRGKKASIHTVADGFSISIVLSSCMRCYSSRVFANVNVYLVKINTTSKASVPATACALHRHILKALSLVNVRQGLKARAQGLRAGS